MYKQQGGRFEISYDKASGKWRLTSDAARLRAKLLTSIVLWNCRRFQYDIKLRQSEGHPRSNRHSCSKRRKIFALHMRLAAMLLMWQASQEDKWIAEVPGDDSFEPPDCAE